METTRTLQQNQLRWQCLMSRWESLMKATNGSTALMGRGNANKAENNDTI